jgi:hypothetical protein
MKKYKYVVNIKKIWILTLSDEKRASDLQIDISVPLLLPPSCSKKNNNKNFVENAGKYRKCFRLRKMA